MPVRQPAGSASDKPRRITGALEEIFPGDPCLGDFALFGYGVSHPDKDEPASDQNFREA